MGASSAHTLAFSPLALTVAERGMECSSATSPNVSPGNSFLVKSSPPSFLM